MPSSKRIVAFAAGLGVACCLAGAAFATLPAADSVYRNGRLVTLDGHDSARGAVAIRAGRIVFVGADAAVATLIDAHTVTTDLHGRTLMPGLVDGHMHPIEGGAALLKCNLNYARLDVAGLQSRIQACLDQTRAHEPDGWLEVVNWFQEAMLPVGTIAKRGDLDGLRTSRPIFVMSSFGHTVLVNSRALDLAGVTRATADPLGGRIARDAAGNPSGILEDSAQVLVSRLIPAATPDDDIKSAQAALEAMRKQGITTFMDAAAIAPDLAAFSAVQKAGGLTARAHFAVLITPPEGRDAQKAVADVKALATRYDQGPLQPAAGLTVRNIKLFMDGVISAPALTGAMLAPYGAPAVHSAGAPQAADSSRGPDVYFPAPVLSALLLEAAAAGFDPHLHADGDRAVREGLDGIAALRTRYSGQDIRAALAHDEIVDPADYPRFRQLDAVPVLSFQWEKRAPDTVDNLEAYLGPARFKHVEPAGFLASAGARVAYGSDWPVDALDEWFALKVGVTRTNAPSAGAHYAGRLGEDRGLSRMQVLRAITFNASYELHQEQDTGSISVGKLADLIVLDRDVLQIPAAQIADVKVLQTVVGGRVVYQSDAF